MLFKHVSNAKSALHPMTMRKENEQIKFSRRFLLITGARGGVVGWGTALQAGRSWVRFPMASWEFFIYIILPAALWHWGGLSLQGTSDRCVALTTLPSSCADRLVILGASTSYSPDGLSRPVKGQLYPYFYLLSIRWCFSTSCRKRLSQTKRDFSQDIW
jgi:hypothetical protein